MEKELLIVFVSVVFGGVITYILTKHFHEKKSLAYEIITRSSLINISPKIEDKIKIEWDGAQLKNVSFFKVRLINDGNVAVKSQPILFSFELGSWVVDMQYVTKPNREFGNIKNISDESLPHEVKIIVDLINPKEEIEFSFLTVDTKTELLNVYAKSENLKFHKKISRDIQWGIASIGILLMSIGYFVFLFWLSLRETQPPVLEFFLGLIALMGLLIFFRTKVFKRQEAN